MTNMRSILLASAALVITGFSAQRPDLIGNPNTGPRTVSNWLNTAAYHQLDCRNVISLDRGYKKRPTLNGIKSDDYGW